MDIVRLAELFVKRVCRRHGLPTRKITAVGQQRLLAQAWPGNVRELAHEVERALVFADEPELDFAHLQPGGGSGEVTTAGGGGAEWLKEGFAFEGFDLEKVIDRLVDLALERAGGNVSGAARLLNVRRDYVRYRLTQRSKQAGGEAGAGAEE